MITEARRPSYQRFIVVSLPQMFRQPEREQMRLPNHREPPVSLAGPDCQGYLAPDAVQAGPGAGESRHPPHQRHGCEFLPVKPRGGTQPQAALAVARGSALDGV